MTMNRSNSEQPLNNNNNRQPSSPTKKRKPRPSIMTKKANSYPGPSSSNKRQTQTPPEQQTQPRRSSSNRSSPTKTSTMKVGGPPSSSPSKRNSSSLLFSTSSSSPSKRKKFKSPTANKSSQAPSIPTPTTPKVKIIQLQQGQSSPTIKIVQPGSSSQSNNVKFIRLPPPIIVPISTTTPTKNDSYTSRTTDDDSSQYQDEIQEKEEPYFSGLLLLLWFLIGSIYIYEIIKTSISFSNLVTYSKESECCGYEISVALGGGMILPTIFFSLLIGIYCLALAFMIMAVIKPLSRSRLVPLVHIMFTVSPLLQAVLFWFFLPILNSSNDALIMMILVSIKLLLQFIAMCLVMRRNLKNTVTQILCHIIVQLHGLAGIMFLYFYVIKRNDGLCYVVGKDGFTLQGCELCPPINGILGDFYPPINGECLGHNDGNPTFVNELPSGTYCSDDGGGTNFCFYEY